MNCNHSLQQLLQSKQEQTNAMAWIMGLEAQYTGPYLPDESTEAFNAALASELDKTHQREFYRELMNRVLLRSSEIKLLQSLNSGQRACVAAFLCMPSYLRSVREQVYNVLDHSIVGRDKFRFMWERSTVRSPLDACQLPSDLRERVERELEILPLQYATA